MLKLRTSSLLNYFLCLYGEGKAPPENKGITFLLPEILWVALAYLYINVKRKLAKPKMPSNSLYPQA